MGRALINTVEENLADNFTSEMKADWVEVYGALSYDMIRAQKRAKA
jgi:hemoglobin-like flavoprotein